ncbi:MAG: hypothetical protein GX640_15595 [Fibrobacter sp.]|nr:hypothetical protein [Fibrobacter sp.]
MEFLKVTCAQCAQYRDCPQKTRLFVNYCGSDRKRVEAHIKAAIDECRARRGHLFTKGFLVEMQPDLVTKHFALSL